MDRQVHQELQVCRALVVPVEPRVPQEQLEHQERVALAEARVQLALLAHRVHREHQARQECQEQPEPQDLLEAQDHLEQRVQREQVEAQVQQVHLDHQEAPVRVEAQVQVEAVEQAVLPELLAQVVYQAQQERVEPLDPLEHWE